MSFNQVYLETAQKACEAERLGEWERASFFWELAIELATGQNRGWAMGRHEYCRCRTGVRPVFVRERY